MTQTIRREKNNKQFMILSAIAIVSVVDAHALSPLYLMTTFMPYNSFLMPMFMFISGYFFKKERADKLVSYCLQKAKALLLPFFVWQIFYGVLVAIFRNLGIITYGAELSVYSLFIAPFLQCFSFEINNPAWFVPTLFMVVCAYAVLRKVFGKIWNEYLATILSIVIGTVCVYFSRKGYSGISIYLIILKTFFMMTFYQLGVVYRSKLEPGFVKIPRVVRLVLPLLINSVLMYWVGDLNVLSISAMSGFLNDVYFVPILTSITGIGFWLTVSEILEPVWGENKLVNYISANTFTIMMHHMLFFNLFNVVVCFLVYKGILPIPFDIFALRTSAWYRFGITYAMNIWYVPIGIAGPLLIKYFVWDKRIVPLYQKCRKRD